MVNDFTGIGRLGQDPEMKEVSSGNMAKCSMAVTEYYGGENKTTWLDLVVFGKPADSFGTICKKGSLVYVRGKIAVNQWEDKDGNKRKSWSINVRDWKILEKKESQSSGDPPKQRDSSPPPKSRSDEDIPF